MRANTLSAESLELGGDTITVFQPNDNFIINGDMGIAQRYTSQAASEGTSGNWLADRFEFLETGAGVVTVSQFADAPTFAESGVQTKNCAKVDVTTADASLADADYNVIQYQFEGYDIQPLVGQPLTLSFWIKATKTGTSCVAFKAPNVPGAYMHEFTISGSDVWQKVELTMTIPTSYVAAGLLYENSVQLRVYFPLAAGSTYQQATTDEWIDSSGETWMCTPNQINHMDNTDNNYQITNVKLELGTTATPFVPRLKAQEIALCQRYFEKSYNLWTVPGASTTTGGNPWTVVKTSAGQYHPFRGFAATKRNTPTLAIYSVTGGSSGYVRDIDAAADRVVSGTGNANTKGLPTISVTGAVLNNRILFHWTADAEL